MGGAGGFEVWCRISDIFWDIIPGTQFLAACYTQVVRRVQPAVFPQEMNIRLNCVLTLLCEQAVRHYTTWIVLIRLKSCGCLPRDGGKMVSATIPTTMYSYRNGMDSSHQRQVRQAPLRYSKHWPYTFAVDSSGTVQESLALNLSRVLVIYATSEKNFYLLDVLRGIDPVLRIRLRAGEPGIKRWSSGDYNTRDFH